MKVFRTICSIDIDENINGIMVLEDVSYNNACYWLEKNLGEPKDISRYKDYIVIKYNNSEFYYDEDREYLIRRN